VEVLLVMAGLLALDVAAYFLGFDSRELGALRRGTYNAATAQGEHEVRRAGAILS
jgi:hypothetical protein